MKREENMQENHFKKIIDNVSGGIILLRGYQIVYINNAIKKLFKLKSKAKIIGKKIDVLISSDKDFTQDITRFLNSRSNENNKAIKSERHDRIFLVTKSKLKLEKVSYTLLCISYYKYYTDKFSIFSKQERFLQRIFDSLNLSITVIDKDQNLIFFSKGAEKLTGYKAKEVIGKKKIFWVYEDLSQPKKILKDLKKKGEVHVPEVKLITKKGKEIYAELFISQLEIEPKNVGSIGVGINITQHKKMEEHLTEVMEELRQTNTQFELALDQLKVINQELEQKSGKLTSTNEELNLVNRKLEDTLNHLNAILQNSSISILLTDENGNIKLFNDGASKLLGYSSSQVLNKNIYDLIEDSEKIKEVFKFKRRSFESMRLNMLTRQRQVIPVRLQYSQIKNNLGNFVGGLFIAFNISEQIKTELEILEKNESIKSAYNEMEIMYEELRVTNDELEKNNLELQFLNEELKKTDKVKDSILQNISHELRTPLTSIIGFADILKRSSVRFDNQTIEIINILNKNATKLLKLINDFLNLSVLSSGNIRFRFRKNDITKIAKHSVNTFITQIKKKRLSVSVDFEKSPINIECDSDRIEEVFSNIIGNAIKFTPTKGRISIEIKKKERKSIIIKIKDTGVGISEEHLRRIYDRFYTSYTGFTKEYEGIGIGLSIVREILEKHNGKIKIKSELGKGTTVKIMLPVKHKDK